MDEMIKAINHEFGVNLKWHKDHYRGNKIHIREETEGYVVWFDNDFKGTFEHRSHYLNAITKFMAEFIRREIENESTYQREGTHG